MFTHNKCQLCIDAKEALKLVQQQVPFNFKEVDIRKPGNEAWFEEYKYDVPVIHTITKLQKIQQMSTDPTDVDQ
ncbi:hypothetical protein EV175_004929 [Coemansia sp. RSA 1933]|nr:hypothetical protein EV175_004929 [Coemansia sp. RSA 1933]